MEPIYASNCGRIWKQLSNRIIDGTLKSGYLHIMIYNFKLQKYEDKRIHRLIAATFFGINEEKFVNHKDDNKLNNKPENLEYVTHQENCIHAHQMGLNKVIEKLFYNLIVIEF